MLDLILRGANLPDGRDGQDIAVQDGRIAEVAPAIEAEARARDRRARAAGHPALRRCAFPHGFDPQPRPAAAQRERHAARRHRAVVGAEAASDRRGDQGSARMNSAAGRSRAAASRSAAMSISATIALLAVDALLEVKQEIAPYLDLQLVAFPQDGFLRYPKAREQPAARPRQGRRCRRRHSAFRAHHGRWRGNP